MTPLRRLLGTEGNGGENRGEETQAGTLPTEPELEYPDHSTTVPRGAMAAECGAWAEGKVLTAAGGDAKDTALMKKDAFRLRMRLMSRKLA